jgi:hypothetical protein
MVVGKGAAAVAACDGGEGVEDFIVLMKGEGGRWMTVTRLLVGMSC